MLRCEECDRCFNSEQALQQHQQHSPAHIPSYDCDECDRSFNSEQALQQHQQHSPAHIPSYDCDECDRSFNSEQALQQHQQNSTRHRNTPLDQFFFSFSDFDYDPAAFPSDELQRLRRHYGWRARDPENEKTWERYRKALVLEFNSWYGSDDTNVRLWHGLCKALKIKPLPPSCEACRQAVRGCHVNMVDLINIRRNGEGDVQVFSSLEDLRTYTKQTRRFFPKDSLEAGALLKNLLREIFGRRSLKASPL